MKLRTLENKDIVNDVVLFNDGAESTVKSMKEAGGELELTLSVAANSGAASLKVENNLKITVDCVDESANKIQTNKKAITYDDKNEKWIVME